MQEIKKGDVVQLKSGGPIMTVQDIDDYSHSDGIENGAKCSWFNKETAHDKVFTIESLELYTD